VTDPDPIDVDVPVSPLSSEEKATRSGSFGAVASSYERYRPGPPVTAVDWLLPAHVGTVVDLGAGTGALTRLLVDRADAVIAVEPDDRMRAVLTDEVPGARAVMGCGEQMPIPDGSVDAVLASSSWHWMDPIPTLHEVGRVLVPGGILGALCSSCRLGRCSPNSRRAAPRPRSTVTGRVTHPAAGFRASSWTRRIARR